MQISEIGIMDQVMLSVGEPRSLQVLEDSIKLGTSLLVGMEGTKVTNCHVMEWRED